MAGKLFVSQSYNAKAGVTYVGLALSTPVSFTNVVASNVLLDPDTKNLFFRDAADNQMLMSEDLAFSVDKATADLLLISEQAFVLTTKNFSDSVAVSEELSKVIDYGRTIDVDSVLLSETLATLFDKPLSDGLSVSESYSPLYGLSKSDEVSLSEVFSRAVVFSRTFTDAFTLDDLAQIDAFSVDTDLTKGNVFGFSDAQSFGYQKLTADSFSVLEEKTISFVSSRSDNFSLLEIASRAVGKDLVEGLSITEALTIAKRSTASSVLNAGPLNFAPLNN